MKVLLVGSGGREHALAWALSASPDCDELLCLPGNPGMANLGALVDGIDPTDVGAVAAFARHQGVDLVVVGPEAPLAAGLVDAVTAAGIAAFGPTRAAARLEASKAFAKEVMARAGVPTGAYAAFTDPGEAKAHLAANPPPYVVKADGLAAGKGVLVTGDLAAAEAWVDRWLTDGATLVVEEFLEGPELSVFAICDGERALPLEPARDYKRLADGDEGPNTGGMGSYSPVLDLPPGLVGEVMESVAKPTLAAMAAAGTPYVGFLYMGLALTPDGPKVIEFNCRLGDPETQVVLPRIQTDLLGLLAAAATDGLPHDPIRFSDRAAVNVVLASGGYPDAPRTGDAISGLDRAGGADVLVFHAGTTRDDRGMVRTAGGRVLSVVGLGDTVAEARSAAYRAADEIRWKRQQRRTDIAAGA